MDLTALWLLGVAVFLGGSASIVVGVVLGLRKLVRLARRERKITKFRHELDRK